MASLTSVCENPSRLVPMLVIGIGRGWMLVPNMPRRVAVMTPAALARLRAGILARVLDAVGPTPSHASAELFCQKRCSASRVATLLARDDSMQGDFSRDEDHAACPGKEFESGQLSWWVARALLASLGREAAHTKLTALAEGALTGRDMTAEATELFAVIDAAWAVAPVRIRPWSRYL